MAARVIPLILLIAAWWPSRITGPLDGAPLDNAADAVVLGLLLPLSAWLTPAVFRTRPARIAVLILVAWKVFGASLFVQEGWCARVEPSRPYVIDGTGAPKNWDVRADWLASDPRCSAIATRPYLSDEQFPVWHFNLPSAVPFTPAEPEDLPPLAVTRLTMRATIRAGAAGVLQVSTSPSSAAELVIDGRPVSTAGAEVAAGIHDVMIASTLTGTGWTLAPLWNGKSAFDVLPATVAPESAVQRAVRPVGRWIPLLMVGALLVMSAAALWQQLGEWRIAAWIAASVAGGAAVAAWIPHRRWHYTMLPLIVAAWLPVPQSLRTVRGAFIVLAPFWLALNVVDSYLDIGFDRTQLPQPGNDWWMFQRYAYRIYMQGYWLEGGELEFRFRPLYRWFAGALHMLFGQSQTGENYWDAIGVLIIALFSFDVARRVWGFRWGITAGALALASFLSGPGYILIGRGLSEITSAAFLYLSALCLLEGRESRSPSLAAASGAFAVFAIWTRENNLPMALAVAAFACPLAVPASGVWNPRPWFLTVWRPGLIAIPLALVIGLTLFGLRTWYFTGQFTMGIGPQVSALAVWTPDMPWRESLASMLSSLLMVATTTDPPRYHNGALPVLAGAGLSVAALAGVPLARRLPLVLAVWTLSGFVAALIARGVAYSGRFSVHVVGCTVAVFICAIAAVIDRWQDRATSWPSSPAGGSREPRVS